MACLFILIMGFSSISPIYQVILMASVYLRRCCVPFETVSSFLLHPRLSFSPNHASPDLYVFSHVLWSYNFHHAAHSSVDIQLEKPLCTCKAIWATLQVLELSQGGIQGLSTDQAPLRCRLQRIKDLLITKGGSCANVLLPLFPRASLIGILIRTRDFRRKGINSKQ